MSECSLEIRAAGKPYPRTCARCGLGPCSKTVWASPAVEPAKTVDIKNRFRVYVIPEGLLVDLLNRFRDRDFVRVPLFEGIPDDAEVSGVKGSWERRGVLVRVHHASFDEVDPASYPPLYPVDALGSRVINLKNALTEFRSQRE